jgi:hypothetical protein
LKRILDNTVKFAATLLCGIVLAPAAGAFTMVNLGIQAGNPPADVYAVVMDASDEGDSFAIGWGLGDPVLSASATFTVTSYDAEAIVLDITLHNTTDLSDSGLTKAAILSMGFGVVPDAVGTLTSAGSVFDMVDAGFGGQQQFAGGFKEIDVCIFAQGCAGGNVNLGLQAGGSDSFQITLAPVSTDFSNGTALAFFPVKFQTSLGSYALPGAPIPEPDAAVAFALGAVIVGASLRRRSS